VTYEEMRTEVYWTLMERLHPDGVMTVADLAKIERMTEEAMRMSGWRY
jgi:hypothetical protein